jgi:VanZ family protein
MIRRIAHWLPPMAWAGLIFYLSSRSYIPVEPPFPHFDKLVHAVEYGVLCILLARAIQPGKISSITGTTLMMAILASFLYGVSDEIHQAFVPMRSCDFFDALFDLLGAILGASLLRLFRLTR